MSGHGAPTLAASDLEGSQLKVAVVASRWHEQIMDGLLGGAQRALAEAGVQDPAIVRVAGSFELPVAARRLAGARQRHVRGALARIGAELLVQLGGELGACRGVVCKLGAAEQGAHGVAVHGGDAAVEGADEFEGVVLCVGLVGADGAGGGGNGEGCGDGSGAETHGGEVLSGKFVMGIWKLVFHPNVDTTVTIVKIVTWM